MTDARFLKSWSARALGLGSLAVLARVLVPADFSAVKLLALAFMLSQASLWEAAWRSARAPEPAGPDAVGRGADGACALLTGLFAAYALWTGQALAWMAATVPLAVRWSLPRPSTKPADAHLLHAAVRFAAVWALSSALSGLTAFWLSLLAAAAACRAVFGAGPRRRETTPSTAGFAWISLSSVAILLSQALPFLFVLLGDGRQTAGLFGAKLALAMFFAQALGELEPVLTRRISRGLAGRRRAAALAAAAFTLGVAACSMLFPAAAVEAAFGSHFSGSPEALRSLILGAAGYTAYQRVFSRGLPHRSPQAGAAAALATAALQGLLCYASFPRWGLNGAAWSYAAASVVGAALCAASAKPGANAKI